jgi:hypothetical protein
MLRRLAAAVMVAAAVVAASSVTAHADVATTVPLEPVAGQQFDTTDTAEFTVQRAPGVSEWALVLTPGDGGAGGTNGFMFPQLDDVDWEEVEIGWLAAKFEKLGRFSWWVCEYDSGLDSVVEGTCTPPRPFFVKFRLTTMWNGDALTEATDVFAALTAGEGIELENIFTSCHRLSRTRKRCRASAWVGDVQIYGRVTVWRQRPPRVRTYDLVRYSAKLRIYDEYCHQVNHRPLSECDKPYKSRAGWTYKLGQT